MKKAKVNLTGKRLNSKRPFALIYLTSELLLDHVVFYNNGVSIELDKFIKLFDGLQFTPTYLQGIYYLAYEDLFYNKIKHDELDSAFEVTLENFSTGKYPYNVAFYKDGTFYSI